MGWAQTATLWGYNGGSGAEPQTPETISIFNKNWQIFMNFSKILILSETLNVLKRKNTISIRIRRKVF